VIRVHANEIREAGPLDARRALAATGSDDSVAAAAVLQEEKRGREK